MNPKTWVVVLGKSCDLFSFLIYIMGIPCACVSHQVFETICWTQVLSYGESKLSLESKGHRFEITVQLLWMVQLLNHSIHSQEIIEYLQYCRHCPRHEDMRVNETDRSLNCFWAVWASTVLKPRSSGKLGSLICSHSYKLHLSAENSQIYTSWPDLSELESYIYNCLFNDSF